MATASSAPWRPARGEEDFEMGKPILVFDQEATVCDVDFPIVYYKLHKRGNVKHRSFLACPEAFKVAEREEESVSFERLHGGDEDNRSEGDVVQFGDEAMETIDASAAIAAAEDASDSDSDSPTPGDPETPESIERLVASRGDAFWRSVGGNGGKEEILDVRNELVTHAATSGAHVSISGCRNARINLVGSECAVVVVEDCKDVRVASTHQIAHGVHLLRCTGSCIAAHAGSFRLTDCNDCRIIVLRDSDDDADAGTGSGGSGRSSSDTGSAPIVEERKEVEGSGPRRRSGEYEPWAVVAESSKATSISLRRHTMLKKRDAAAETEAAAAAMGEGGGASATGEDAIAACTPSHAEQTDLATFKVPDTLGGEEDAAADEGGEEGPSARTIVTRRVAASGEFVSFVVKPVAAPAATGGTSGESVTKSVEV